MSYRNTLKEYWHLVPKEEKYYGYNYQRNLGLRHCIKDKLDKNEHLRCAQYAPGRYWDAPHEIAYEESGYPQRLPHRLTHQSYDFSGGVYPKRKPMHHGSYRNFEAAQRNPWIHFVRRYAKDNNLTYAEALQDKRTKGAYKVEKAKKNFIKNTRRG